MESVSQFEDSSNPAERFLREKPLTRIPAPEQPATWDEALEREKSDGFLTWPSKIEDALAVRECLFTPGEPRIVVSFYRAIRDSKFPEYSPFAADVLVIYQHAPRPRLIEHIYERLTGYEFLVAGDRRFSQLAWDGLKVDVAIALARLLATMAREATRGDEQ